MSRVSGCSRSCACSVLSVRLFDFRACARRYRGDCWVTNQKQLQNRSPHLTQRRRMANYKAADSKREQFRRYLEKAGVLDTLTKVLVELYEEPEKPNNALDFLKQHMGAAGPETPDVEALRLEVAELKQKYEAVLEENKELKAKLAQHEPPSDDKCPE